MPTTVSVSEYGAAAPVVGTVSVSVPVNPQGIWDSCMEALQAMIVTGKMGYKSSQTDKSVARPGAWSGPATNLGAAAQNTKWKPAYLAQPHVHLGAISDRAVIGCVLAPAVGGTTYLTMNIYIGQSS
jgi:hypothetical protein